MANQVVVTNSGNVQVSIEPQPNVQVEISRAAITTLTTVPHANTANTVTNNAQPNITSLGILSNLSVSGNSTVGNLTVTGNLSVGNLFANNANYANFAGNAFNVSGANVTGQVNFANVANNVAVGNVIGIGNIATVNLDGNTSNILYGNGVFAAPGAISNVANANYANFAGDVVNSTQSNITTLGTLTGLSINGNITGNLLPSANITYDLGSPTQRFKDLYLSNNSIYLGAQTINANATSVNFSGILAGDGSGLSNIAGANVTGTVANANYASYSNVANSANSVAVGNISGIGNIATVNLDGNASNILYGNGVFAASPNVSNVANANYANFAGTAYSVSGSNVSGEVANANYASYANISNIANTAYSVSGANVSGEVANANYATFAGTAYSVSGSNVSGEVANANYASYANISNIANTAYSVSGANVSGEVANANYATFAGTAYSVSGANVSGEVANANFASYANISNIANTAYSVSGANVSGEVANANYASYANIANSANSVAVGNVVGIGNIATINLDGNSSNALLGNGGFGPVEVQSTSIANGTSNINIPTANGNIAVSVNNNSNLVVFESNVLMNANPLSSQTNALRINSIGNPQNDAHRITWFKSRGTVATPSSVQANDPVFSILSVAHNGTSYNLNYPARIQGLVDSTYTTNTANIPIGMRFTVIQTTESGSSNIAVTHNFWSNGNVTFAQTVNAGNFAGNGASLSNITGANVTGTVANATYAINAGNANIANLVYVDNANASTNSAFYPVFVSSTGNGALQLDNFGNTITYNPSTGVLTTNTVKVERVGNDNNGENIDFDGTNNSIRMSVTGDSNALVISNTSVDVNALTVNNGVTATPTYQILPNSLLIGNTNNVGQQPYSTKITNDYGNGQLDGNLVLSSAESYVRYRGNSTTPTALSAGDRISRNNYYGYNGTANILAVSTASIYANTNSNANAVFAGGQYSIQTGNPLGDTGNANALSAYNTFTMDQYGRLVMTQGTAPTGVTNGLIVINHYGGTSGANANTSAGLVFNRYFGNRDSNLGIGPGAQTGRIIFLGANTANTIFNTRVAQITASVDTSYVAGNANIPQQLAITTCDNTTSYTTTFGSSGNVTLPANLFVPRSIQVGNGNVLSQIYMNGDKTVGSGLFVTNGQMAVTTDNVDTSGGFSPFFFSFFNNANSEGSTLRFYRARGTNASRLPVQTGDQVSRNSYGVYGDVGNNYLDAADTQVGIISNDGNGNIGARYTINVGYGTAGIANSKITLNSPRTDILGDLYVDDYINIGTGNIDLYANGEINTIGLITTTGNVNANNININSGNIDLYANGDIDATGRLSYLRTYASFYNPNDIALTANTVANLDLPNTYTANGISIASNNQITVQRAGTYNIQMSLQLLNTDNAADHEFDVWFAKNGTDVADSATSYTVVKNNGKNVVALNFVDTCSANDYYQIRFASSSANISLEGFANITTPYSRPAIPSAIVTVVPVGA